MRLKNRGQSGVEYLMITSVLLLAVGIFFFYAITSYQDSAQDVLAKNVVDSLASTASQLSSLGNNSSLVIEIDFPDNIDSFAVNGNTVQLFLGGGGSTKEYYAESKSRMSSITLSTSSGRHRVKVTLVGGEVVFTEA